MNAPDAITLGLVRDLPAERYHAIPAMSAGGLKRMRQSPAHFYGLQLDPARPPATTTPAMAAGTLFHTALFEPEAIDDRYVLRPDGIDLRTKEGKAWAATCAGRTIVTHAEWSAASTQAANVRALPDVAALMADGYGEASAFWIDPETGELCKCRPDWVSPAGDGVILVDGKSCQDASPAAFAKTAANMLYDLQCAHYCLGVEAATGLKVHGFVFACVEAGWPHAAAAYMLPDEWVAVARVERRDLLNRYAECKRSNRWPGHGESIQLLEMPKWRR